MNNFVGGGLHTSVDFSKPFHWMPSVAFYARVEGSGLFGDLSQSFTRTEVLPNASTASGSLNLRDISIGVAILDVECGLSYMPLRANSNFRVTSGYKLQQWFYLGDTTTSSAGITLQGVFLRGEFGY